ncbi:hypothetical protein RND81_11G032500 [Saponaria officinalis]|uniref:Retrotransposon Copia-like N-terminal domain-containing protein n=1 Tax=Saponaria officinalis TaxID=3572 RepID=A0AAW1HHB8_SAPOF
MDPLLCSTIESTHTLKITTTLTGSENYPLWRRQMELALSAKRKQGYVTGKVTKPKEDEEKIEAWMVANNQRYTVSNGARKFKLNRESYEICQNGRTIEEYFTQLQVVWDELENMNTLPAITKVTTEIAAYLAAVDAQAGERKLFQFLNGLDKQYGVLRSNILMKDPLPSVDDTVSLMLQEEMQAANLGGVKIFENSALMGNGEYGRERCTHCGRDNHKSDLCWEVRGYPVGHPKHKKAIFKPAYKNAPGNSFRQQKPLQANGRTSSYRKPSAAHVKAEESDLSAAIGAATL